MLRIRPLLLVAALLAALIASADSAAVPQAPTCKPGELQVRLAVKKKAKKKRARLACRAIAAPRDPMAAVRDAAVSPAELRAALPKRYRKRFPLAALQPVDRIVARRPMAPRAAPVTAHAAAAGDCSKPATPSAAGNQTQSVEGGTLTTSGGSWGEPGSGTWGTVATVRGELSSKGAKASKTETTKECVSWDTCPDADGVVTGTFDSSFEQVTAGSGEGASAFMRITITVTAKLKGHVGGDGRVKTFDWDAEGTSFVRGEARQNGKVIKSITGPNVRLRSQQTGADPRSGGKAPGKPTVGGWGLGGSVLDGTSEASFAMGQALYGVMADALPDKASKALLGAERVWYDDAACLDVAFDPQPAVVEPNAKVPVSVKVKAQDGADVEAPYDAQPVDGAVGPPTGTTPATVTWTAPGQLDEGTFETFRVVAVSKRGRAIGTHTARGQKGHWWRVTYQGAGEYHRSEPRSTPYPQLNSEIHFRYRMVSMPARIPYFGNDPNQLMRTGSEVAEVTGDAHATRVDGGGTDTCDSSLDDEGTIGWVDVQGGDGGFHLDVVPFPWLKPTDRSCPFDDMLIWMTSTQQGMEASIHIPQSELDSADRIERHVTTGGPWSADCWGGTANGDWPCTESVTWEGTIVLERVPAPPGEQP
ncbi:MAG TPA: hypothetical protein VF529_11580 [Solirubrobacteraceae bacterium]|jgi:hypothetical protein